ncbi:MAG: hypothetical protein JWR61_2244 [Ferruginibacter sp.]|uniref:hypothetical protein n=1 Tax=Ferruginibacter sp. TaxID=1940288 RepID=UPI002658DFD9|nr:hypothetical protein [Ferruginibacter sp.]MDB5277289.1 hypothetical protein [Ferruginibacter sp.]
MNYVIERFDQLIAALASPDKRMPSIKKESDDELAAECRAEKERIRMQIMAEVFTCRDEKALALIVEKYQSTFIRMIDQLYPGPQANTKHDDHAFLIEALHSCLNELLCFLQVHFAKYFNHFQKLPLTNMEGIKTELKPELDRFITAVQVRAANEKLIRLIVQPVEQFILGNTITYALSQYMKGIIEELLTIDLTLPADAVTAALKKILIRFNFNSPDVTSYLTNELELLITAEESIQGKLRMLKYKLKEMNQVTVKPNHALYNDYPGLKDQLIYWLEEEFSFYQTEQTTMIAMPDPNINDGKIHTSLSVAKLALIIKLLVADKIIINRTVAPMLRVAAKTFTTLQKEDISFGSLETKYHAPDKSTTSNVRDMLFKWINIVNKL